MVSSKKTFFRTYNVCFLSYSKILHVSGDIYMNASIYMNSFYLTNSNV